MMENAFLLVESPFSHIESLLDDFPFWKNNKKIAYCEIPCAFDIETTSFYRRIDNPGITCLQPKEEEKEDYEKCAIMYAFVIGINGKTIIGRTWEEALHYFKLISKKYGLSKDKRMVFYIHNSEFEMQFFRKLFHWEQVFSIDQRRPLYCLSSLGIEFRCSYLLTNYSLSLVGEHLYKYKVKKMVGDLDYELFRHSKTKLTAKEVGYIVHDALVVMAHVQQEIERLGSITRIPYTSTGYVRNYCRVETLYNGDKGHRSCYKAWQAYTFLMQSLTIEKREYELLNFGFAGGFTHCSCMHSGMAVDNVGSFDFTSAYPAVMVMEQFPMSKGKKVEVHSYKEFKEYLKYYCCLFIADFKNLKSKISFEHYLSFSKCMEIERYVTDNGRVVRASKARVCMTDVDFTIMEKTYSWDSMGVVEMYIYRRGYLPTSFVYSILQLYKKKTELKGVEGMEAEYMHSKNELNATFGMCVTKIVRNEIAYTDDNIWTETPADTEKQLERYNKSRSRFLYFPWGVWITAYNRLNLWSGILECGYDYVYSDTDSIKVCNPDDHLGYIKSYNELVKRKLELACEHHGFPFHMVCPKTNKGVEKMLGVWDYEGTYDRFKSLGAKRYMIEEDGEINITVSGVSKRHAVPFIIEEAKRQGKDPFDIFEEDLVIPPEHTGKMLHTYIDDPIEGNLTDYQGRSYHYHEETCVHLEKTSYHMSLAVEYINYLLSIREEEVYG